MNKSKEKYKKILGHTPGFLFVSLWVAFAFVIFGWVILASLSSTRDIFTGTFLSNGITFNNYKKALIYNKAFLNLVNSIIYTVPTCILVILISAPAAYCISRFSFKGKKVLNKLLLICLGIPSIMIIMPLFSIVNFLNISESRFTLILIYTTTATPFTTFFLMSFFKGISQSFEEAAAIDGCSPVKTFWIIMFPLAQSAILTVTIFNFIAKWNEYFMALVFANKSELRPIGVGLYQTIKSMMNSGDWAGMFASVIIVFIPTLLIYLVLSDKIVNGITSGGIKG
jgi:N-acetylglucosamine transport system permease protein